MCKKGEDRVYNILSEDNEDCYLYIYEIIRETMEIEYEWKGCFRQYMRAIDNPTNKFKKSLILHSGKTEQEEEAIQAFTNDALSEGFDIICRDEGYYMSRHAYGSSPHSTYECLIRNEDQMKKAMLLIQRHLGKVWKR